MPPDSIKIPDISAEEDVMVIHRNIGLGKDLDWLKDLQAQKILLISKDSQQQRRLKLQLLQDARFIVLTEEEAAAAQIRQLQEEVQRLQERQAPLEEKVQEAEDTQLAQQQVQADLEQQTQQEMQQLQEHIRQLESRNQAQQSENESQQKQLKMLEVQLELLRDILSQQETSSENGSKDV